MNKEHLDEPMPVPAGVLYSLRQDVTIMISSVDDP